MSIAPDELPDLLTRLYHRKTTDFVLVGKDLTWLSESLEDWPKELPRGSAVSGATASES